MEENEYGGTIDTKEYWDAAYSEELKNFGDHGDFGDIWFGEETVIRVVNWIKSNSDIKPEDPILDLGCGNGFTLIELARERYTNLTGIDYSEQAIQLARSIAQTQQLNCINFTVCDLTATSNLLQTNEFAVAIDKGTYDTVSLNKDCGKRLQYAKLVYRILKPNGIFIIVSCNWTEDEIIKDFQEGFKLQDVIPTPTYKFGSKVGNLVTFLVFLKVV